MCATLLSLVAYDPFSLCNALQPFVTDHLLHLMRTQAGQLLFTCVFIFHFKFTKVPRHKTLLLTTKSHKQNDLTSVLCQCSFIQCFTWSVHLPNTQQVFPLITKVTLKALFLAFNILLQTTHYSMVAELVCVSVIVVFTSLSLVKMSGILVGSSKL